MNKTPVSNTPRICNKNKKKNIYIDKNDCTNEFMLVNISPTLELKAKMFLNRLERGRTFPGRFALLL